MPIDFETSRSRPSTLPSYNLASLPTIKPKSTRRNLPPQKNSILAPQKNSILAPPITRRPKGRKLTREEFKQMCDDIRKNKNLHGWVVLVGAAGFGSTAQVQPVAAIMAALTALYGLQGYANNWVASELNKCRR
jgi:hypothetical protein